MVSRLARLNLRCGQLIKEEDLQKQRSETKDGLWGLRGDFLLREVYLISRFIVLRKANIKTVWLFMGAVFCS